jgi:hypothetical protein
MAASRRTEAASCRRVAPTARRSASSRVRWLTSTRKVLAITNPPTSSATNATPITIHRSAAVWLAAAAASVAEAAAAVTTRASSPSRSASVAANASASVPDAARTAISAMPGPNRSAAVAASSSSRPPPASPSSRPKPTVPTISADRGPLGRRTSTGRRPRVRRWPPARRRPRPPHRRGQPAAADLDRGARHVVGGRHGDRPVRGAIGGGELGDALPPGLGGLDATRGEDPVEDVVVEPGAVVAEGRLADRFGRADDDVGAGVDLRVAGLEGGRRRAAQDERGGEEGDADRHRGHGQGEAPSVVQEPSPGDGPHHRPPRVRRRSRTAVTDTSVESSTTRPSRR